MYHWRITKYDPVYRDSEGNFKTESWTSYSDIGKIYEGGKFTITDYLFTESKYINAIITLMECMDVSSLEITNVEKHDDIVSPNQYVSRKMADLLVTVKDGDHIGFANVPDLCRLILREHLWGKLSTSSMFVHFGYDYYMYIGTGKECLLKLDDIKKSGLFVEPFVSPYLS